jgi:hypothetical protein
MKHLAGPLIGTLLLVLLATGCRLIVFPEKADIETCPCQRNQVLAAEDPIYVRFGFEADHLSAEECLAVRSGSGNVAGLKSWENETLFFLPRPALIVGQRYVLALTGAVRCADGRTVELDAEIPFYYAARDEPPPCITAFTPASGEQVSTAAALQFSFSKPMDGASFKEGFSLRPDGDILIAWNVEGTEVTVSPDPGWANNTVYEAQLSTQIQDALGIPLPEALICSFYAADDLIPPEIIQVVPALRDWEALFPTRIGLSLDDLEYRDVIKIVLNEPMDAEKTAQAVILDPPLALFRVWTDDCTLVLVPEAGFEMAREYRLLVGREAVDSSGNHLMSAFAAGFTAAIPELILSSLDGPGEEFPLTEFSGDRAVDIDVGPGPVYTCTLTFAFGGAGFPTDAEKLAAQQQIVLRGLFPAGTFNPEVMGYGWIGDQLLEITFTDFSAPSPDVDCYYLLELPGGLRNDSGSFLAADIRQLLRVRQ